MDRDIQQAEKMALKSKEEIKKRMRVMFPSSSVDLEDSSFSGPGDNGKLPSPSSRKRRFPSMRRVFGKILSILMPCVCLSSEEEDSSFVSDRKTDASFSAAVHRSSEGHPENDLPAGQQKEAVEAVTLSTAVLEDPSTISDINECSELQQTPTNLDAEAEEMKPSPSASEHQTADREAEGGKTPEDLSLPEISECSKMPTELYTDISCIYDLIRPQTSCQQPGLPDVEAMFREFWVSDLTTELKIEADEPEEHSPLGLPNLGNTCYMNSVLQCLLSIPPFQHDVFLSQEVWRDEDMLLSVFSDLFISRLDNSSTNLKKRLLRKVKCYIENASKVFTGDFQQDAHEFLMLSLSCLKEEGQMLKMSSPTYTCPVANMEFKLETERTCVSCGLQKTFTEDANYISLVLGQNASVSDSLQQYMSPSSVDCMCCNCNGTKASVTQRFYSFPRVLVLLVSRFDMLSDCKLRNRLRITEELTLSSVKGEIREQPESDNQRPASCQSFLKRILKTKTKVAPQIPNDKQEEPADTRVEYRLTGAVSHLGSKLFSGHYISHIRDPSDDGWLRCSDFSVRKISWTEASEEIKRNCYMLFYIKR
ncbi:ubiquitin carboxyl-terminal hydrolase 46-like isoform X3 [Danio rerio]|uniref:Ubiquitin carboxyl-terminal hydrolase 46-like isoform X3 n=1 Tax=Danio rerio TaxID=7955 RepID=A0AC58G2X3_DANRE